MRKMLTTSACVLLTLCLSGCVGTLLKPALTGPIRQSLSSVCPTPSNLTPAQAGEVADAIESVPPEHVAGITILATEWDRLDQGARICKGN